MTEKQGGSDVRANTTRASPVDDEKGPGKGYALTGHKWFCSAPMSDAFLTLAYTDTGISCFLVPRVLPDGSRNTFLIQRLKDKLGNRSNASSEIEYNNTWAMMIGEEGKGVKTIIEMVHHTRLDCAIGSAGLMRLGVSHAIHHATHRKAFGNYLVDQPMMSNVLADLALESEAATASIIHLSSHFESTDEKTKAYTRLATALIKFWVCKRLPQHAYESMECLGGNGFVEEGVLARLYREAPLNAIWEGSGNVIALDVFRTLQREPIAGGCLLELFESHRNKNSLLDSAIERASKKLQTIAKHDPQLVQFEGRRFIEELAVTLQACILYDKSPEFVSNSFCQSRLARNHVSYGTLTSDIPSQQIVSRAFVPCNNSEKR